MKLGRGLNAVSSKKEKHTQLKNGDEKQSKQSSNQIKMSHIKSNNKMEHKCKGRQEREKQDLLKTREGSSAKILPNP